MKIGTLPAFHHLLAVVGLLAVMKRDMVSSFLAKAVRDELRAAFAFGRVVWRSGGCPARPGGPL